MNSLLTLSKEEKTALAVILVFALVFFKPVVAGDGFGYYVVLEGVFRDNTFNFTQQLRYNEPANGSTVFFFPQSQQYVSQYPPGMALLSAPFYLASLWLDDFLVFHIKDEFFIKERGDILIHQLAAIMAPVILFIIALLFSLAITREAGFKNGAVALLLAFFGTPIIRYATYDLYYTHAAEAGLLTLLVYCFLKKKPAIWLGVLVGILTLVRYTSVLYLIPISLYLMWQSKNASGKWVLNELGGLAAGFIPFLLIALAYFTLAYGSPFTTGYAASGALAGNFVLIPTGVFNVLFSTQSGLLLWSPVALLALIGLYKWRDERKWLLLGLFAVMLWHTSAFFDGTTGYSFSNRYYAAMFPVFVLGAAAFIDKFKQYLWVAGVFCLYNLSLFLLSLAGAFDAFPSLELIYDFWFQKGNISRFPELLFEKISVIRLLLER